MKLYKFYKLFRQRWYVIALIALICIVIAFLYVQTIPGEYPAQAKLAYGLTEEEPAAEEEESQAKNIHPDFDNLVEIIHLKKIADHVSYKLLIHDLTSTTPFRILSREVKALTAASKEKTLTLLREKAEKPEALDLLDPNDFQLNALLQSMHYDETALRNKLTVTKLANSELASVECIFETPVLSAYVTNEFCNSTISFYTKTVKENQFKTTDLLYKLMQEKMNLMNEKMDSLKSYKIDNKIINLYEQSKTVYNELLYLNAQRYQLSKDIRRYKDAVALTGNNIHSISAQLDELNYGFNKMVPYEAVIESYERSIDICIKEYLDAANKYNQSNLEANLPVNLKLLQPATPTLTDSSNRQLLILLSGVAGLGIAILSFLFVALSDRTNHTPKELAVETRQKVLGHLNLLPEAFSDTFNLWYSQDDSPAIAEEKRLLRSLRFEIDQLLTAEKNVLSITSLEPLVGKSFLTIHLAYAFAMMKKEVLLIDGNFSNPVITQTLRPSQYIEDILQTGQLNFKSEGLMITVAGNRGEESSLLEVNREEYIRKTFQRLPFDIILIETEALHADNKAKEWIIFSSNIVAVYEAGKAMDLTDEDRIKYLQSTRKFNGWILNKVSEKIRPFYPVS